MKISIVIPSFNQGRFIGQTLESILSQGYSDLEVIVMDGGSKDETIEILKDYESRFPGRLRWVSEKDKGQTDAINKGLRQATGDILAWLCSDDVYQPGTLQHVAGYFAAHPEAQLLSGEYQIIDEHNKPMQSFVVTYKKVLRSAPRLSSLLIANYINQPSTFWRRSLVDQIGYPDDSLHYCMDYDYWLRAMSRFPLHTTPKVLSSFRIHSLSKSGSRYHAQFKEEFEVVRKHTHNPALLAAHKLHTQAILAAYSLLK